MRSILDGAAPSGYMLELLEVDLTMDGNEMRNEELRRNVVEKMWLYYYNDALLEQGLITESMHRKMTVQISTSKPKSRIGEKDNLERS